MASVKPWLEHERVRTAVPAWSATASESRPCLAQKALATVLMLKVFAKDPATVLVLGAPYLLGVASTAQDPYMHPPGVVQVPATLVRPAAHVTHEAGPASVPQSVQPTSAQPTAKVQRMPSTTAPSTRVASTFHV